MKKNIAGIHHITAIADDPQKNIDFYGGILGLRFIKKTVNFDDPGVYHFYYGNETGEPGTILTFFTYTGARRGRRGRGMVNTIGFSAPAVAAGYWKERLEASGISFNESEDIFGAGRTIRFSDNDGLALELVFNDRDKRTAFTYGDIPAEYSIPGFYNASIRGDSLSGTMEVLSEIMDHDLISQEGNSYRFAAQDRPGHYIDYIVSESLPYSSGGTGTVHHIAFLTEDEKSQTAARKKLVEEKLAPTGIIDRQYFKSVYFREPGGVLFEIATAGPGFMIDEDVEGLGSALCLPPQYESMRTSIEKSLKPVEMTMNYTK